MSLTMCKFYKRHHNRYCYVNLFHKHNKPYNIFCTWSAYATTLLIMGIDIPLHNKVYYRICYIFWSNIISTQINDGQHKHLREKKNDGGPRINQEITAESVRVVDSEGEMLGVMSVSQAIKAAKEAGLDLVEVSPNAEPPVCKIIDYGKYKYELQKKKNIAKKNQKVTELKEVQIRPMIDKNDLDIKCKAIERFIAAGNKVKILMRFRGRELAHQEIGINLLKSLQDKFIEIVKVEVAPKLEGRQMIMVFAPIK